MLWTFILLSSLVFYSSAKNYSLLKPVSRNSVEQNVCLEKLISKVSLPDSEFFFINSQLKIPFPVVYQDLSLEYFHIFKFRKPDVYIVTLEENQVGTIVESLLKFQIYNPRATFIMIVSETVDKKQIFLQLSKYFIYDVILLERESLSLTTYEPFKNENVFDENIEQKILANCESFDLSMAEKKLPKLWRNTTVSAVFHDFFPYLYEGKSRIEGGDFYIYRKFIQKSCFKNHTYSKVEFAGFDQRNGSYDGTLKKLFNREATVLINVYEAHEHLIHDFDMVPLHMGTPQYWVVPHARPRAYWKAIIFSFNYDLWLIITLFLVVLSLIWMCLENKNFPVSFLMIYQILIETSVPTVIKVRSNSARLFVFAVSLAFLVQSTTFKTAMIRSLTSNSYESQINSLKDIIDYKLTCNITEAIQKTFEHSNDTYEKYVKACHTHQSEKDSNKIFEEIVINKRNVATISRMTQFKKAKIKFYHAGYKGPLMHMIPTPVVYAYMNLYLAKGSPYYHRFLDISRRLQSNGITKIVYRNEVWESKRVISFHQLLNSKNLSIKQVAVAFYILFIGLVVAFGVFLAEVLCIFFR
ncbi:uncharacterized protein LOC123004068 [Tribolium madens]|uniref:uncharacterized protein LOC123004068 n=1 Tax=Tribolium madens TaxID=41895 RepID=UPI001CF766A0|nr:uncharacterized protein LOC123004068 [Tribolium madens]